MEIACKAGDAKVVAAFPDVCLSPPSPPAGPVPIPYPVTSKASDTSNGSKSVKISGKEIMLKNKSYYKNVMEMKQQQNPLAWCHYSLYSGEDLSRFMVIGR